MGYLAECESGHGMIERDIPHDYFMFRNPMIQRKATLKRKLQRWRLKTKWITYGF